jgi:hypothetical protein
MNGSEFLKAAIDPELWLDKSAGLRRAGNRLWDCFFEATLRGAREYRANNDIAGGDLWAEGWDYLTSAKSLYGLSAETALKAHMLRNRPEEIEFKLIADGSGVIQSAELKQFGVQLGSSHNLEQLAQRTGILTLPNNPIFKIESDLRGLREILRDLSDVVYWRGRYPVPTKSGDGHQPSPDVPAKVFGHYIRDWIDPMLDYLQAEHAPDDEFNDAMARISHRVTSESPEREA